MKKFAGILTAVLMTVLVFGCGGTEKVQVYVADGAPLLAVANVIADGKVDYAGENGKEVSDGVEVSVVDSESLKANTANGQADLAIIPTNMAASLYNGGVGIRLVTVNTYGLLYLVGRSAADFTGYDDLVGEVVELFGKGGTPDLVLKQILRQKNIEFEESDQPVPGKVALNYAGNGAQIVQKFAAPNSKVKFGLLPEPAATAAIGKQNLVRLADLQRDWKEASGSNTEGYPQASLVVQQKLLDEKPGFVKSFVEKMKANLIELSEHPEEALKVIKPLSASISSLTPDMVERMNLKVVGAVEAKPDVEAYLSVFGIELPDTDFYCAG